MDLGKSYGKIMLKDRTLKEAGKAIKDSLQNVIRNPHVLGSVWPGCGGLEFSAGPLPQPSELLETYIRDDVALEPNALTSASCTIRK